MCNAHGNCFNFVFYSKISKLISFEKFNNFALLNPLNASKEHRIHIYFLVLFNHYIIAYTCIEKFFYIIMFLCFTFYASYNIFVIHIN